jgi:hypothetical protein
MPNPRLLAIVTGLILVSGGRGFADYTVDQLKTIEQLILARDTAGLGQYLAANAQVTVGDDPLAVELRRFLGCARTGQLDCFAATRVPVPSPLADGPSPVGNPPVGPIY